MAKKRKKQTALRIQYINKNRRIQTGKWQKVHDEERGDIKYKSKWMCEFYNYGTRNIYTYRETIQLIQHPQETPTECTGTPANPIEHTSQPHYLE